MAGKPVVYFPDARGEAPALTFLLTLGQDERRKAFAYVSYLEEQGERLRRSIAEYLGERIYELRPKQVRILYAFAGQLIVILHAFRKKTGPVPPNDKRLAQIRLADFVQRYEQGLMTFKRQER